MHSDINTQLLTTILTTQQMPPVIPLSRAIIAQAVPLQTLSDLLDPQTEIENDLDVLLHWLQPYYPQPGVPFSEPLARTRAAARRCLKEKAPQLEFVRLCINSIRVQFQLQFAPMASSSLLAAIVGEVHTLRQYYLRHLSFLHLSRPAHDVFVRGLNGLFVHHLLLAKLVAELGLHVQKTCGEGAVLKTLAAVGMAETVRGIVVRVSVDRLCEHVSRTCSGVWNEPVLQRVQEWVRVELYPGFAQGVFENLASGDLVRIAHDELVVLRTSEIYEMVASFPHSTVALRELHLCLVFLGQQAHHRARLVDGFVAACTLKLLHLGANTVDVITTYTKTIKSFLLVDPTGVLLDKVVRPIRRYLKTRPDLVLQLVHGMLDNSGCNPLAELAHELHKNKPPASAPVDDLTDVNWVPDPIDALPDFKKGKVSDVVEALVLIFDLPAVFVDEFTRLFGERLLQWHRYSVADIVHHVDLLKTRFGADEFATLDVMIKDVHDSIAVNEAVALREFLVTTLSQMYWPTVCESLSENDFFRVPVQAQFEQYCGGFSGVKKGRGLKLVPSLGTVLLELCFAGGAREFVVTPAQATVIDLFDEEPGSLSAQTVATAAGMSEYAATLALGFWVKEGVLRETGRKYKVIE